jgi:PAS domain S-box-containing protein
VPLRDGGQTVGVLNVESTGGVVLGAEDLRLVAAVGEHVDVALHRARLYEEARAGERRFRSLVQNAFDVITILDPDGTIRYESPAIRRVLGHDPAELVGTDAFALVHPDDRAATWDAFAAAVADPALVPTVGFRFRHKDGSWRWLEATGTNLLADPDVGGFVVNSRDVTERRRAEAALRASEARLGLALESAAMGTWEWDPAAGRVAWSAQTGPLYGLPAGTPGVAAADYFALVHPDDRERVRAEDARVAAGGADYAVEFRAVWPDGTVRWLEGTGRVTGRGEDGRPTRILGVTMDVTERKRLAAAAARAAALAESDTLKSALLGVVSHELKTPLASVMATVGALRSPAAAWEPGDREEALADVDAELDRLA